VANKIVSLIRHPQSKVTIGAASGFLKLAYAAFPLLSRNITAALIRGYLKKADAIETTSGNVLEPVEYGRGIDGGWRGMLLKKPQKKRLFIMAGIAAGLLILSRGK
jgi:hypothetical protein